MNARDIKLKSVGLLPRMSSWGLKSRANRSKYLCWYNNSKTCRKKTRWWKQKSTYETLSIRILHQALILGSYNRIWPEPIWWSRTSRARLKRCKESCSLKYGPRLATSRIVEYWTIYRRETQRWVRVKLKDTRLKSQTSGRWLQIWSAKSITCMEIRRQVLSWNQEISNGHKEMRIIQQWTPW